MWVSSKFTDFLPHPKNMQIDVLVTLIMIVSGIVIMIVCLNVCVHSAQCWTGISVLLGYAPGPISSIYYFYSYFVLCQFCTSLAILYVIYICMCLYLLSVGLGYKYTTSKTFGHICS